ncbi:Serine/threonine-protein kinase 17A [Mortierella sp. GBA35]|nr:Serine/threonine-protein kinase 17A [Mortierella sp. AD031]KAF9095043.1 Serine/threonine-protein kinase 17A [Mortierella sp. GBA35]KAG0208863.1 Serine/threonine-protein kinase 17A [Mortierella sp. NVP41]
MAVQSIPTQSAANFNTFSEPSSIASDEGESKSDSSNSSDLNSTKNSNNRRSLQLSFAPPPRQRTAGPPIRLALFQRRQQKRASYYGQGHPLIHQIQTHIRSHSQYHIISPCHTKSRSMQLAGKLEDIMSSQVLQGPLNGAGSASKSHHHAALTDNLMENAETASVASMDSSESNSSSDAQAITSIKQGEVKATEEEDNKDRERPGCCSAEYVYTAPCEHHPSKGQTDYLVNDMFPKLEASSLSMLFHDLSTIEFGIRIADFMPLAFKTVPVAGLAEKELELLHGLRQLPHVIQLQDSFVNDSGDTVLVLPMLKPFDIHAVNNNLCSVRKTMRQVLTGLAAVHAKDIVHLDINPSNLMVTHAKRDVVVIDFGLSMTVDRKKSSGNQSIPVCGTTGYIAPEILNPAAYGKYDPMAADLYSLGIVLGEMLEAYIPDCDLHYFGSKYLGIENTNQSLVALQEFIAQGACYPKVLVQAADLLQNMLQEDPKSRRSAQELLDSHPFLAVPSSGANTITRATTASVGGKLELGEWTCRLQEIKYQKYLYQEQRGCEVYRYR